MVKLYWGRHTCAIGIHLLLEEIGKPYGLEELDFGSGAQHKPPFSDLNPKGKVPTILRDDGAVLTEYGAIATWLARTNPDAKLLPEDPDAEARVIEAMDYAVGTVHAQGFGRIFMPQRFEPQDVVHGTLGVGAGKVKQQGEAMVKQGFAILDRQLAGKPYVAGTQFTIADSALFYVERWAPEAGIELPAALAGHLERMKQRPSVQKILPVWGES